MHARRVEMRLIAIHICNVLSVCVCLCICVFDTLVTPAKTDELIIMSFEMWTRGSFPKKPSVIWGPAGIPLRKGILLGVILGHGRYYQQYSHGVKSDAPSG